jgi:hypothetical protein
MDINKMGVIYVFGFYLNKIEFKLLNEFTNVL